MTDSGGDAVTPIDLTTDAPGSAIAVGSAPFGIAITPDGRTAYVTDSGSDAVTPIDLSTDTPGTPIPVGSGPDQIAITPDGHAAYVVNTTGNSVTPIDLATNTPGAAIPVNTGAGGIAIAPDGQTAYVGGGPQGQGAVTPIDTATNSVEVGAIEGAGDSRSIVITPDQAPNAGFTASAAPAGELSTLDASSSSSPVGSIARYAWDLGDGQTETTTTAVTRHAYARPGTYDVRLTVTNTAGTSLTQVYTGQTVSREGGPAATTSRSMTVLAASPVPQPALVHVRLVDVRVIPHTFSISGRRYHGRCVATTAGNRELRHCRRAIRVRISYLLNIPTTLTLTVSRQLPGRRVGRRCVVPSRHNRSDARCVRLRRIAGRMTQAAKPGHRSLLFTGRIGGHRLTVGTYRISLIPRNSAPSTTKLKITR